MIILLDTDYLARIEVITGCMKSGKTDELIRRLERAQIAGYNILVFKPAQDDRFSETEIVSRSGRKFECFRVNNLKESIPFIKEKCDVIGLDEIQFFNDNLHKICQEIADSGVRVIASGLSTDFQRKPFMSTMNLISIAEKVDKLSAICECGSNAYFTQRIDSNGNAILSGDKVMVGDDEYRPRCRKCFISQG